MADVSKLKFENGSFDIKDTQARNELAELDTQLTQAIDEIAINVKTEGAKGDGSDETSILQTILNNHGGKLILFPYGSAFKITKLTIPDNTFIWGYGAKLYNTETHESLLSLGNNVNVYGLELEGAGNSLASIKGVGISVVGVDHIYQKTNITLRDCYIHDIGFYGVYAEFGNNIRIENTKIERVGYAGIGCSSVQHVNVDKAVIKDVYPGEKGLAYGVFFTRKSLTSDLVAFPRSSDCSVINSTIENVEIWEALDTHGGRNISFMHNVIKNCKVGLAFVASTGSTGSNTYGVQEPLAIGNKIYGNGKGAGIIVQGTTTDPTYGAIIEGNKLYNCGQETNNIGGAILVRFTNGTVVQGNNLKNCFAIGIHLFSDNKNFVVVGNSISDVHDSEYSQPTCIAFRAGNNEGVVTGNSLSKVDPSLNEFVSKNGINISVSDSNKINMGINYNTCDAFLTGGIGTHVNYALEGLGIVSYVGSGSPEGVVSAPVGSIYKNQQGGENTTLFIKTSGSGSTGWVGK